MNKNRCLYIYKKGEYNGKRCNANCFRDVCARHTARYMANAVRRAKKWKEKKKKQRPQYRNYFASIEAIPIPNDNKALPSLRYHIYRGLLLLSF